MVEPFNEEVRDTGLCGSNAVSTHAEQAVNKHALTRYVYATPSGKFISVYVDAVTEVIGVPLRCNSYLSAPAEAAQFITTDEPEAATFKLAGTAGVTIARDASLQSEQLPLKHARTR